MKDYRKFRGVKFLLNNKFIKYCITGVFNTAHHYIWFLLMSPVIGYSYANVVAFIISNIVSYFINSYYTFRVLPSIKSFVKYPTAMLVQALVSYLVPFFCLMFIPESKLLVPILTTVINLPIGYLLVKKILIPKNA